MSVATGAGETNEFATLLRQLKDRSGLSYGALAKRLHMSTSTLHRYCNGTAVPNEYAPVERLARVCRATPEELMELHRRWILADAARDRRAEQAAAARAGAGAGAAPTAEADPAPEAGPARTEALKAAQEAAPEAPAPGTGEHGEHSDLVVSDLPPEPVRPHRRRTALIAAVTVAAVLGAVVLAVNPPWGAEKSGQNAGGNEQAVGATGPTTGRADATTPSATPPSNSTSPSGTPSAPLSATPTPTATETRGSAPGATGTGDSAAPPLSANVHPYVYDDPCSQHFLVDSEPAHMGPPASEQDAPRWAAAYGAVSSDEERVSLTVQGTGSETVVLEALHVRVVSKAAPLAWNDYAMGVGCGGGVGSAAFDIDLDKGSPHVTPENGQRDFPYSVSESDPEVFYVTAHTKTHDVRWDLLLDWSSGARHGTLHLDDKGIPFRTSADVNRPGYDYPPGYSDWIKREGG
ncbi:helix-turn-helix domain-containing protein [Streptomyces sp. CBMA29]|uniref:helix-turn-helix domain-containing protein n=1 Tax=Streptomyces sp. CBMA29 TaxID=1896314 RepID=UPI001661E513|nr:helix-turn-helix transcriptional regulator [Streptomyces sp. CBMA29]MBD0740421.1 transcriptional regulator [Streptomyces sp. CBMA29]